MISEQYTYIEAGHQPVMNNYKFYSPLISSAQRLPNEWVPQLAAPTEKEVPGTDITTFRVPGSECREAQGVIDIEGAHGFLYLTGG